MKLVLLGTTGYHPNDRRHTACMMLPEAGIVLDAGTGMYRLPRHLATPQLDIFITHAHLDHIVGLTFLLGLLHGRTMQRVTVHGVPEKLDAVREHLFAESVFPVAPCFELRPIQQQLKLGHGCRVRHFPLVHPGGAIGLRLDWPQCSMAYVTDTTASPQAPYREHIRGVDVLLHECYFSDAQAAFAELTGHSHTTAVAQLARDAEVGCLILVHMDPANESDDPIGLQAAREIFPHTYLGEDNMEIEF
jgi:ribonuclease BN (tRNA processing enzyme)